jgi:hypothetical protein
METKTAARLCAWLVALHCLGSCAYAGPAAAELSLDRAAVRELLRAALPDPVRVELTGLGSATLRLLAPARVEFSEGGIEATFPLEIEEAGWRTPVAVRLVPRVDPLDGTVRLVPESVRPELALPIDIDLSAWIAALELPRRFDWPLGLREKQGIEVTCFLQRMTVQDERVVLELGLSLGTGGPRARAER